MLHSWWVEGGKSDSDDKEISKRERGWRRGKSGGVDGRIKPSFTIALKK